MFCNLSSNRSRLSSSSDMITLPAVLTLWSLSYSCSDRYFFLLLDLCSYKILPLFLVWIFNICTHLKDYVSGFQDIFKSANHFREIIDRPFHNLEDDVYRVDSWPVPSETLLCFISSVLVVSNDMIFVIADRTWIRYSYLHFFSIFNFLNQIFPASLNPFVRYSIHPRRLSIFWLYLPFIGSRVFDVFSLDWVFNFSLICRYFGVPQGTVLWPTLFLIFLMNSWS